jgi:hypothetical protein
MHSGPEKRFSEGRKFFLCGKENSPQKSFLVVKTTLLFVFDETNLTQVKKSCQQKNFQKIFPEKERWFLP